ncbi:MAG: flagellar hook-associated protein FlgL, partial [Gammaproteobacteria bacterium]
MRVTTNQMYSQSLARMLELQASTRDLQTQISSGKRISTPGDDPVAAVEVMQINDRTNASTQFDRNGALAEQRLTQVDDVLGGVSNMLQRVNDLLLQGRSEQLGNSDRDAIAKEIREQMDVLLDIGNTRTAAGEFSVAGAKVGTRPV